MHGCRGLGYLCAPSVPAPRSAEPILRGIGVILDRFSFFSKKDWSHACTHDTDKLKGSRTLSVSGTHLSQSAHSNECIAALYRALSDVS